MVAQMWLSKSRRACWACSAKWAGVVVVAAGACLLGACGEEGIEEQEVAKGVESVAPAGGEPAATSAPRGVPERVAAAEGAPDSGASAGVGSGGPWVLPQGWREVPGEQPMRLATFEAPDESGPVEVALTRFPGRVGGELANINRWRGQMGLGALSEGDLESAIERFEAPGFDGYQVRVEGATSHMLAAGVYEEAEDWTWFVRATTSPEAADRVEGEVFGFARSIAGAEGTGGG